MSSSTNEALRSCTLEDEKLDVSNGRWVRYPYPDDSVCLPMVTDPALAQFRTFRPQYYGDKPPHCWHRDDLTQIANVCGEPGCQFLLNHRWLTDLKKERRWFGRWEPYECHYDEMDDRDIQKCVDQKNITKIETQGLSVKGIVEGYLKQKMQNINMATSGNYTVTIDTLRMPHLLWHESVHQLRKGLENYPDLSSDGSREHYFLSSFYYTSEREPHVQVDRALKYSKIAFDILSEKGYRMINAFDPTGAFGYDTDGQVSVFYIHILWYQLHAWVLL